MNLAGNTETVFVVRIYSVRRTYIRDYKHCIVRCVYSTARVKQKTTCPTQLPTSFNRQLKQVSAMFLHRTAPQ